MKLFYSPSFSGKAYVDFSKSQVLFDAKIVNTAGLCGIINGYSASEHLPVEGYDIFLHHHAVYFSSVLRCQKIHDPDDIVIV